MTALDTDPDTGPSTGPDTAATTNRRGFHPLRVSHVEALCDDAAAVTFEVPGDVAELFDFAAGQSLTLRRTIEGREHRRTYSICAPAGSAPRVGVRVIPDGLFSTWLVNDLQPGDVVEAQPPSGSFSASATQSGSHLCIAAGSGITPMLSIAATVLTNPESEVTLLYGNRRSSTVMFAEELADLKDRHGARLQLVHLLSREPRDVELFSGRIDADRLRRLFATLVDVDAIDDVWLCGPVALIEDARTVLAEHDFPADRIHYELFYVDAPPPQVSRPDAVADGATSDVTIVLDGRRSTEKLARDQTILDAAQATRSDLPFACKGGVCGTCRAKVTSGETEMHRNYALDEAEVAAGFVLTCQTFPLSDDVTVDFDA